MFLKFIIEKTNDDYEDYDFYKYVKLLSKDKKPEFWEGGFIIYANNSRWFLKKWGTWELYWIPESFYKNCDYKHMINRFSLEFYSTWLPKRKMYKICKRIIHTHPNLKAKGYWKVIKFFNE